MLGTTGTSGSVFDAGFIGSINGYFSEGTSTELMGPLIYSLVRSTRPKTVVELGAGYTSFWLCRAVMDAKAESEAERLEPVSWSLWDSPVGKNVLNEAMAQGTHSGTGRKLREAQKDRGGPQPWWGVWMARMVMARMVCNNCKPGRYRVLPPSQHTRATTAHRVLRIRTPK